jgi:hypothetical protein
MKITFYFSLLLLLFSCQQQEDKTPKHPENFAIELLEQVRSEKSYIKYLDSLENASIEKLNAQLNSDAKKKSFWINCYNALVQIRIKENPASYQNIESFFEKSTMSIGGSTLSLIDVQSTFLLRKASKKDFGPLLQLQLKKSDPRILFALNCGSSSCPPIAFYSSVNIDIQLDLAEALFIKSTSRYDPFSDEVNVSELLKEYEAADPSKNNILFCLKKHQIIPQISAPEIIFAPYNWSPQLPEFRL